MKENYEYLELASGFFGISGHKLELWEGAYEFDFEGGSLKYRAIFNPKDKVISVSGDLNIPFGGCSLYEMYLPFDRCAIETEPRFYGERKQLVFRKDYADAPNYKTLMIMKWDEGEYSVWATPRTN